MAVAQSALAPFTIKGFYLLTWGTALGTNVWNTLSGYRSYKTLPRQTFGQLQSRLTPLYFSFTTLTTATLFLTHLYFHPGLISSFKVQPFWFSSEEGVQGLLILGGLLPQLASWLYVGPKTTEVMFERHRLERLEDKQYDDPSASTAMAGVNKRFALLHGTTSILNTIAFISLAGLGLAVSM